MCLIFEAEFLASDVFFFRVHLILQRCDIYCKLSHNIFSYGKYFKNLHSYMYLLIFEIIIIFGVYHSVKMLNHNICNSVIIFILHILSLCSTTCTITKITLLNYMFIYLISPSNFVQLNTTSLLVLSWYK